MVTMMKSLRSTIWLFVGLGVVLAAGFSLARWRGSYVAASDPSPFVPSHQTEVLQSESQEHATATFGAGCFWCSEAVFQELDGVVAVISGYSGGDRDRSTYAAVSTGESGHAEVVQITYDPQVIGFDELLQVFWKTHDPTTLNRQGADVGPQYRSVIFYHDETQKDIATQYKRQLDQSGQFAAPIVTEISPFERFYTAEGYHQNFFSTNPDQPYCRLVIGPKLQKFRKDFGSKLRKTDPEQAVE